nr:expansin-like B1 [Ipomoea batatas]GMD82239.1 expansin-like B1 [Ipomoea batatas]
MAFTLKISYFTLLCIFLIFPSFCHSKLVGSRATFYKQPDGMGTPDGACGYKGVIDVEYTKKSHAITPKILSSKSLIRAAILGT